MEQIPKKLFYKIGEVCDICQIQPHVLRYWETEFSQLSPSKNTSGQRVYRYRDVQLVHRIKQLLYQEGYTIAGANRKLSSEGFGGSTSGSREETAGAEEETESRSGAALPFVPGEPRINSTKRRLESPGPQYSSKKLDQIRAELQEILDLLARDD